jgi:DNA-directed RNA polymerase specialized sigma24 family protein
MQDEIRRKNFETKALPHLRDLRLTSLWLTKNRPNADDLMRKALNKAFRMWRPSISKSDCRVLLFKVLTGMFFDGFQKRPDISSMNYERNISAHNFHDRLTSEHEDPTSAVKRTIVRLPVEVGYINFLSKLDGFSPEDIADIVGIKLDGTESRPEHGSRLLQSEPFTYGGQG